MAEQEMIDRKLRGSRITGMSLYATSADYERRISEVIYVQEPEPVIVDEALKDNALAAAASIEMRT
jgi:hypothetical protein